ncbi:AEC family transporter [Aquabacterium sp. J223]|uniref:AEC family transporter n=1 Tax=Aquabacterium sp. J223 TaxID=2898431 RepID=UPI0021ADD59C|nr:AEC family transporter [Aquabacterium sp. J223]UUX95919.1 AEC family transporter [Aquabacterium sp. J223]
MSMSVLMQLLVLLAVVVLGYGAGRRRWLGPTEQDPARVLSQAALYLFIPALLFRTLARLDLHQLPWSTLAVFFGPVGVLMLVLYAHTRRRLAHQPAAAGTRALAGGFGNTVQVGIPMASAMFGETGLGLHLTIVSLHALILLTLVTTLTEFDLARHRQDQGGRPQPLTRVLGMTAVRTVLHPVVLPILAGMAWNLTGLPLPAVADDLLRLLGQAVVPLCLLLVGMSLAYDRVTGGWPVVLALSAVKLLVLPAAVLATARWGVGLDGLPLQVVVMAAALPTGANALIFSQRYRTLQTEAAAVNVVSTLAFGLTAPLWLLVLQAVAPLGPG